MVQFFFEGAENIVGKGENAGYQHFFFFFLAMFSKALSSRVVENQESFGKDLQKELQCKECELHKFSSISRADNSRQTDFRPYFA